MIDRQRNVRLLPVRERAERHRLARRRLHVTWSSESGLVWNGVYLEHHMVLVQLREDGRDLPLAEGIVERVVDHLRRDAEARRGIAVDDERRLKPPVCWSEATSRSSCTVRSLSIEARRPGVQLVRVGCLQRVLILRTATRFSTVRS